MKKTISDLYPFGLRIPEELKAKLQSAAKAGRISLNTEILRRLDGSFKSPLHEYPDGALVAELMSRYEHDEIYIRIGKRPADDA